MGPAGGHHDWSCLCEIFRRDGVRPISAVGMAFTVLPVAAAAAALAAAATSTAAANRRRSVTAAAAAAFKPQLTRSWCPAARDRRSAIGDRRQRPRSRSSSWWRRRPRRRSFKVFDIAAAARGLRPLAISGGFQVCTPCQIGVPGSTATTSRRAAYYHSSKGHLALLSVTLL
jgi:hypothetical protein